ncbi:MAG: c-type cytochrome [Deltaproteobacteria bacterium]|nr:c-type cytochrome [Deltaproteobacteria bacterium]MDZ4343078.1 c-type cytochrome [Candidatus Binatia bacterium]
MGIDSCIAVLRSGLFLFCALVASSAVAHAQADDLAAKGQYIFAMAGGCACHTEPKGTHHVGARAFPIPFGTVYSTNITQDKETGLGAWTEQQIQDAMTKGIRRDGSRILPVMPYEKYSGVAQDDMKALIAYLRTLRPVMKATPELKSWTPFARSIGTPLFLKVFGRFSNAPAQAPKSGIERGRYLVDHVSLCGDCHTPRNMIGVPNRSLYLAGAGKKIGPLGNSVPNLTPDKETGIGEWKREDIAELLISGTKPDLDNVQGLMEEVIQGTPLGYKDMKKEDALAIADYLKSIPAIKNKIE